jgi:phage/plasmid-like protein (TIGR03299 family)
MAHDIFYNAHTGKHSFFSVKEKAWHGLGQIVQDYPTSAEAIKHAHLDYEVVKLPLFTQGRGMTIGDEGDIIEGYDIPVPDFFATVRTDTDTALGVVGKDYEIVQNAEAFSFFDSIVGSGDGILYETAGALGQGERIFITAKLPDYIRVGNGDDVIEKYLFLTTSHDGSGSITAAFTPVRVVCANTLAAALRNMTNVIRIRHTANAKQRLETAHKVMGIANNLSNEMEAIFNQWSKVRITDAEVKKLIRLAMSPNKETLQFLQQGKEDELSTVYKNTCEDVFAYGMTSDTQQLETTKGTLFGAYNSVTGYFQNVRNYGSDEAKVKSILMGGTAAIRTQTAFNLCTEFAKSGNSFLQFN